MLVEIKPLVESSFWLTVVSEQIPLHSFNDMTKGIWCERVSTRIGMENFY